MGRPRRAMHRRAPGGRALLARALCAGVVALIPFAAPVGAQIPAGPPAAPPEDAGARIYRAACAACHGADGRGAPQALVAFDIPLPDFTDCSFATREPDEDWMAVTHDGGPARGFDPMMAAFGDALTIAEIQSTLDYIRTLCDDPAWPRGELNLPRALFTEKAYPEDEAVFTTDIALNRGGAFNYELLYEKRFGPRNQIEFVLPIGVRERAPGDWTGGVGDIAIALKRAVYHSLDRGTIFSIAGELILPTGDEDDGLGSGATVIEPFVALGQILPADAFLQFQGGAGLSFDRRRAPHEAFARAVLGRTFTQGRWGRAWSPMVEVLAARELNSGTRTDWDVVPQLQVTLNTRQHIMANAGLRVPLTDTGVRQTRLVVYLLWDWFDGGFLEGW